MAHSGYRQDHTGRTYIQVRNDKNEEVQIEVQPAELSERTQRLLMLVDVHSKVRPGVVYSSRQMYQERTA